MRILQVVAYFYPAWTYGGPVRVAYYVARQLVRRGHEVTVYTSNVNNVCSRIDSQIEEVDGIEVYYFRNASRITDRKTKLFITPEMIPMMRKDIHRFDVIHLHEYRTFQNLVVHHYAKKYAVPFVLQAHGTLPRIMAKQRLKWLYDVLFGYGLLRDASKVIALSRMEAEQYRGMGVPEEKIAIIPNGIDLSEYANLPHKGCFKKKVNIHNDKKIILYLGRVHNTKGIDFLVNAYAYLLKNTKHNNVILVIAGPDDGYLSKAKELASSLGISSNVLFLGFLTEEEKICAYVDSSFVVSPERFNVFLLVPLEAAACGKSVIVSTTNHISHMIRKGEFGFSVKYGDIEELAEVMGKMLNNDDLVTQMGQKGRKFIFGNCDAACAVSKLEKVYEEIVK